MVWLLKQRSCFTTGSWCFWMAMPWCTASLPSPRILHLCDSSPLWAVPQPLLCGALSGAPLGSSDPPSGSRWLTCTGAQLWASCLCLEPGPRGSHTLSCSPERRPVGTQLFLKGLPWGILPGQLPVASLRCQAYRQRSWCRGSLIQAMKLLGWCNEGVNWSLFLASMNLPLPKGSYRQKAQLDIFQSDL